MIGKLTLCLPVKWKPYPVDVDREKETHCLLMHYIWKKGIDKYTNTTLSVDGPYPTVPHREIHMYMYMYMYMCVPKEVYTHHWINICTCTCT